MKNILMPFSTDPNLGPALSLAAKIAGDFESLLEGLFVHVPVQIVVNEMVPAAYVTQMTEQRQADAETAEKIFRQAVGDAGLGWPENGEEGALPAARWTELRGQPDLVLGEYGRLYDLIVIARNADRPGSDWETNLEAALFESGRPVLLAPSKAVDSYGRHIIISWNGSTETACAITAGMPFLKKSEKVTVLTVEGGTVPGPSNEDVAERLARHGLNVQTHFEPARGRSPGEAILEYVAQSGADFMIKGAYTNNRLRQMIFGGMTREIVASCPIPVLMAH